MLSVYKLSLPITPLANELAIIKATDWHLQTKTLRNRLPYITCALQSPSKENIIYAFLLKYFFRFSFCHITFLSIPLKATIRYS